MELKTKVQAEENKQEIMIIREFDLPVELLFSAYSEPALVEQWMNTHVLKLENKRHGSYQFETTDPQGNKHGFNGVIHECVQNQKITRTFEMENTGFAVQLEYLEFEKLSDLTSKLKMHIIFQSVEMRNQLLQMPFAQGLNMAHNRLQEIAGNLN